MLFFIPSLIGLIKGILSKGFIMKINNVLGRGLIHVFLCFLMSGGDLFAKTNDTRKFNTANALYSLAGACSHAGNAVSAQSQQEKQQAVCNFAASLLQTAAVLSEKTNKKGIADSAELKMLISPTLAFLKTLSSHDRAVLLEPRCTVIRAIAAMEKTEDEDLFIKHVYDDEQTKSALIDEISFVFKKLMSKHIAPVFRDACRASVGK